MRNKETRNERIINSIEMVETSFKLLSDKRQIDELNKGIYLLLEKFEIRKSLSCLTAIPD
jgi:hypothetical protein